MKITFPSLLDFADEVITTSVIPHPMTIVLTTPVLSSKSHVSLVPLLASSCDEVSEPQHKRKREDHSHSLSMAAFSKGLTVHSLNL